ncbi:MAG: glycosyltransferase family 4 protein [Prevotellaceae bacterium]|jgi:glycosyltransferase involved in cell wall biosynthesis|nr:glycosyltransferase family 4 protein [Prevotellaceae bacterium]
MDKKRAIAFVCTSSSFGGLEMNMVRLAKWIQDAGYYNVLMLGVENAPLMRMAKELGLSSAFIKRYTEYIDVKAAWKLKRLLKFLNVSVVFTAYNKDLSMLGLLKNLLRSKVRLVYQQQMNITFKKKDLIHTIRYAALDIWISPLESMKQDVLKYTRLKPNKIKVIPLCVDVKDLLKHKVSKDEALKVLHIKPNAPLLGVMGRIDQQKRQLLLLEAALLLRKRGVDVEVLLVGEPTRNEPPVYMEKLKSFVEENNMHNYVYFRPFMNDVAAFYRAIDIFVMSSIKEPFGMVTVEAMVYKTPIIGSGAGGTMELLTGFDDCGLLFEPDNMEDLADKIQELLSNPDLAEQRVKRAFDVASKCLSREVECEMIKEDVIEPLF